MANIFEGIGLETPTQEQERRQKLMLLQLQQQPSSAGRFGVALATALGGAINRFRTGDKGSGLLHRLGTGYASPEAQQAAENEQILSKATQEAQKATDSGTDPLKAQADALMRASAEFGARGRGNVAAQLQMQAQQMLAQIEVRTAELDKLRADTRHVNAQTDALGVPDAPKDELTRMQDERDRLTTLMRGSDMNSELFMTLGKRLDETNARIAKINAITGRTEFDLEPSKPTINLLQKTIIENQDQLDNVNKFLNSFSSDYFTFGGRFETGLLKFRDWMSDKNLSDEEKQELMERTINLQAGAAQINAYIKAITGATVGQAGETQRLQKNALDVDNDGPTTILAKAKELAWQLPAWNARAQAAIAADDLTIAATPLEQWRVAPEVDPADEIREQARKILEAP